jgi:transposase
VANKIHEVAGSASLRERRHSNVVAVALANKNARIAWAMLATDKFYEPKLSVQAA